jgi:phosphoglycolate phosphatase-like HAD superfamily hydrolase
MVIGPPLRLVLFDLDSTLMRSGGAGMRSIARAFKQRFDIDDACAGIVPDGKTDPAIFREVLRANRLTPRDEDRLLEEIAVLYKRFLRQEMPASTGAMLLPGVVPLLEALTARADVLAGLLTGNLEPTARIKLERFGLNQYLRFGAFASDDERRERLVSVAVSRAEARVGQPIGLGRHVIVVGDTPRDIHCALANGVTAVGVATGRYPQSELSAAGAHVTLQDLSDTDAVTELLTTSRTECC